jgi:hypothetical protein
MLTSKQITDVARELSLRLREALRVQVAGQPAKVPENKDQLAFDPADVETALKIALQTAHVEISEWMAGAAEPDC